MLRADATTGNVYGFLGEGGFVTFENVGAINGEADIVVYGNETVKKREFLFGQDEAIFSFTAEEIDKIGEGEHPYSLYTKDSAGNKNTFIPDMVNNMNPTFNIYKQE